MATEIKMKYVDLTPSEWPKEVQAAIAAYFASKEAVQAEITKALRSIGQLPANREAVLGWNYGKIGLGFNVGADGALTMASKAPSVTAGFTFPTAPAAAAPVAAPAPQAGKK